MDREKGGTPEPRLPRIEGDLKRSILCLTGVRLEIILMLSSGPAKVCDLVDRLDLSYSNISHGLGQLRRLRCVTTQRDGISRIYELSPLVRVDASEKRMLVRLSLPGDRTATLDLPRPGLGAL